MVQITNRCFGHCFVLLVNFIEKMFTTVILLSLIVWTPNACPVNCSCSRKRKMINCANSHRTSVPDSLSTEYATLILRYNRITDITNQDLATFHRFKKVDLRNNPLNCSQLIMGLNLSNILTDCTFETPAPGPTTTTAHSILYTGHQTFAYTTERLQTGPKITKSKTFWIVFVVILVVTLSIAFTWCVCKKSYGERVITTTSIELDNLTGHSFDEEEEGEIEYEAMIKIKQS